jgi:hypothetical protein
MQGNVGDGKRGNILISRKNQPGSFGTIRDFLDETIG